MTQDQSPMLGLRTTIYHVQDLQAAKKWFEQAFRVPPYFDEPFYVGFNIAGYELGLLPQKEESDKHPSVIAYWGVDDVEKEYARLLDLGATPDEKPTNVGGPIVVAAVKDPWGNRIGLIYNPVFQLPEKP